MKPPQYGPLYFYVFSTSQGKATAKPFKFQVYLLLGYTIAIFTTHLPGQQMWQSLDPCPTPSHQVLQNSGSQMFMFRVKTLSVLDRLSATQNGQLAAESFAALNRFFAGPRDIYIHNHSVFVYSQTQPTKCILF